MELPGLGQVEIKVNPELSIHVSPQTLEKQKDVLTNYCKAIPEQDRTGFLLFIRHTKQDHFLGQLLMAIGDHYKIWKRFPETYVPWNLPNWPCAHKINKEKGKEPLRSRTDDSSSTRTSGSS